MCTWGKRGRIEHACGIDTDVIRCQPFDATQVGVTLWQRQVQRYRWTARRSIYPSIRHRSSVDNLQHFAYGQMLLVEDHHDEMVGNTDRGGRSSGRGSL